MKHASLISLIGLFLFIPSCVIDLPDNEHNNWPVSDVTSKDGHLRFKSSSDLVNYLEQLESLQTRADNGLDGFTSIVTRKNASNEDALDATSLAILKAEDLLTEPTLRQVMDTSLIIEVGDRVYKITENGTFSFPLGTSVTKMYQVLATFNTDYLRTVQKGASMEMEGGVIWINTYGVECEESDHPELLVAEDEPETRASSVNYNLSNNLHNGYNTTTYTWTGNSLAEKFLEVILIKDYTERIDLDSSHRLCVQLYNNNWGFVEVAGLKTYMQKKVKILFVNTWWETDDASCEVAMGINYMYSAHKNYMNTTKYMAFSPSNFKGFSQLTTSVTGYGDCTLLYGQATEVPYFSNWGRNTTFVFPYLNLNGDSISSGSKSLLKALFDESPSKMMSSLKLAASKRGYAKRPAIYFIPAEGTNTTFKNDRTLASGVEEYSRTSSQRLKFLSKGGFSWSGGVPTPIQFSTYDIDAIDCFGAIYYNGKWKGIRYRFN